MMSRVQKGMVAGFAATLAVSVLELVNIFAGPWVNGFPRLLSVMLQTPDLPIVGWIAHFVAGTVVLGGLFGVLCPKLPTDTPETKGIVFAVGALLVMMMTVAPLAGLGMFAARAGLNSILWLLVTHAVFGIVLGNVYARLVAREKAAALVSDGAHAH